MKAQLAQPTLPSFLVSCALALGACSAYDEGLLKGTRSAPAADGGKVSSVRTGAAGQGLLDAGVGVPDAGRSCVEAAGSDYCGALPALPAMPQLDGQLECGLTLSPMAALGWSGLTPEPGKHASYAAAWRGDGLYLYVEVHGDAVVPHPAGEPIFCGDAVELFVDANADAGDTGSYQAGTMQFVIAAPASDGAAVEAGRFAQGTSQGAWISKGVYAARLPDGFSVEAFIGAADLGLWQWTPAARLGFSIGVDVAGRGGSAAAGCSNRAGQFFLRLGAPIGTCPGEPWCDAGAFCRATLM
jgi:hypothetical protein